MISTYTTLLRTPSAWRFLTPGLIARLPYAMLGLGIVLLVKDTTGSYGIAGAVSAAMAVALSVVGPQTGRLADRYGQAVVLVPGALLHGISVAALIICAKTNSPTWTLFVTAIAAGASVPQIGSMVRARWVAKLEGQPLLPTAFAFESVTDEFTFVVGPVVATFLATGIDPGFGLAVEAVLTVVGSLAFAAQRSTAPARRPVTGTPHSSAIRVAGVKVLVGAFVCIGAVFGSIQVSITAFAEESGRAGLAGALYAVFAGGSLIAGAVYGAMAWRGTAQRRLTATFAALAVGTAPLLAVPNIAVMVPVALICGLALAPTIITGYTLVEGLVAADAKTEAFTWLTGAIGLGLAFGSTFAGIVTDEYGASPAFALTFASAAIGLVVVTLGRRTLVPEKRTVVDVTPVDAAPLALGR
ncbi:MFS transporter [Streptodolium elevatio]|uniref:MFS transporter n=1 Tax=Streptodolium elevatio TaxID=3157996 RepID=A0ABV3DRZ4_9ACTN